MGCCPSKVNNTSELCSTMPRERRMSPLNICIVGDSDRMEIMDEIHLHQQTSIKEIQSPNLLKFPSETIIIEIKSGSSLPSPIKQKSSKNLNQKFLEML